MRSLIRISAVLFAALLVVSPFAGHAQAPKPIVIHAKRYAFSPAEITLKKGRTATLIFISKDVDHGLSVPGLGIHADILHGQPSQVVVTPAETGDFPGACTRYCGTGHSRMKFTVHVVP